MKNLFKIFLCFVFPSLMFAQTATEEALGKACTCFNTINFFEIEYERVSFVADSCFQEALYTNLSGVLKENNTSLEDSDGLFIIAQLMSEHLTENCKGFQDFSKRIALKNVEEIKKEQPSDTGLLYKIDTEESFPVITIITSENEAIEYLWLREFDGSTRFMEGLKDYENTVVEVVWREIELYNHQDKSYEYYKEILLVEEQGIIEKKEAKDWIKAYLENLKSENVKNKKNKKRKK